MKHPLCFNVCGVSGAFGWECAEPVLGFVDNDPRSPVASARVKRNTKQVTDCSAALRSALILAIHNTIALAQIVPSAIGRIAVNVVNLLRWHGARHEQYSHSMHEVRGAVEAHDPIAIMAATAGPAACWITIPSPGPYPITSARVVGQKFFESFRGDWRFHCASVADSRRTQQPEPMPGDAPDMPIDEAQPIDEMQEPGPQAWQPQAMPMDEPQPDQGVM